MGVRVPPLAFLTSTTAGCVEPSSDRPRIEQTESETAIKSEGSVEIDRPIDEVFRLTCDHVAEWSTIVVEDDVVETTSEGVGSTFRTVTMDRGKRRESEGVITRLDPPRFHRSMMMGKVIRPGC